MLWGEKKSGHTPLVQFCIRIKTTLYALDNNVLAAYKNIYMYKRVGGRPGGLLVITRDSRLGGLSLSPGWVIVGYSRWTSMPIQEK